MGLFSGVLIYLFIYLYKLYIFFFGGGAYYCNFLVSC